jgi:hypothetical protein
LVDRRAAKTGPATDKLNRTVLSSRNHPQQAYRSCLGILRLGNAYSAVRLETSCQSAMVLSGCRYKRIESMSLASSENFTQAKKTRL